jgi:GTPase SAR1 family protein
MLGESGVGKSSILGRFAYNKFTINNEPTVSGHFASKTQTIYKMGG